MRWLIHIFMLLFFCMSSCSTDDCSIRRESLRDWLLNNGKLKVLCTTAMIADLVKIVGGEQVDVLTLIRGELNPHTYQLVKGDDEKLSFAEIIFANGLGLEHGPSLHYQLEHHRNTVFLGDVIMEAEPSLLITLKGVVDPHIWMDVSIWKKCIRPIQEALIKQDEQHATVYQERALRLEKTLSDLHEHIVNLFMKIPENRRFLVTSHDAFNYFTKSYLANDQERTTEGWRKRFSAPEGLSPDSQLSSTDIQYTMDFLFEHHTVVVFPESNVSRDSLKKIVDSSHDLGIHVRIAEEFLYGDAMGCKGSGGDSYEGMLLHNAQTIAYYLSQQDILNITENKNSDEL